MFFFVVFNSILTASSVTLYQGGHVLCTNLRKIDMNSPETPRNVLLNLFWLYIPKAHRFFFDFNIFYILLVFIFTKSQWNRDYMVYKN